MKNAEQLNNAVNLLREATAEQAAPDHLETRLRAAFREQHQTKARPFWLGAWVSAAAGTLAVGAIVWKLAVPGHVEAPPSLRPPAPIASLGSQPAAPVKQEAEVVSTSREQKAASVRIRRSATPLLETRDQSDAEPTPVIAAARTEEFDEIPNAPPMAPQDRGEVIPVRLPKQTFDRLGIPIQADRFRDRVPAELFVGEDGIPRGIRVIYTNEKR